MKTKEITLTVAEILDLAKSTGLLVVKAGVGVDKDDMETQFTIIERKGGIEIGDGDGKNPQFYPHGAYITDYPEEGTYPLGNPIGELPL